MISRLVLCLLMICFGLLGLLAKPAPLTAQQLQAKARWAAKEKICAKPKRRKNTLKLCQQWGLA
jgi:hypothetical protein